MVLHGHYPVILACNGKPRIHLDQDTDAWLRRLVVLSLNTPEHEQHFSKMAELILKNEAPGILNWLLEGRTRLAKDKLQLTQTQEQKERAATLLLASDSPAAFVRSCLVKKRDEELGVVDLYSFYQEWCRENHIRPFASRAFTSTANEVLSPKWRFSKSLRQRGQPSGARGLSYRFSGGRATQISVFEDSRSVWLSPQELRWRDYAAWRKTAGFLLTLRNRANIHRLCVNTPQAKASFRCSAPLARIGRPRNPCLRIPIRPSVCARRRWRRANLAPFMRRRNSAGFRGHSPSKVPPALSVRLLSAVAKPRSCGWQECHPAI